MIKKISTKLKRLPEKPGGLFVCLSDPNLGALESKLDQ